MKGRTVKDGTTETKDIRVKICWIKTRENLGNLCKMGNTEETSKLHLSLNNDRVKYLTYTCYKGCLGYIFLKGRRKRTYPVYIC
jgi:hypothetical protein